MSHVYQMNLTSVRFALAGLDSKFDLFCFRSATEDHQEMRLVTPRNQTWWMARQTHCEPIAPQHHNTVESLSRSVKTAMTGGTQQLEGVNLKTMKWETL